MFQIRKGFNSIWGRVDHVSKLGDGIWFVSTPSHGGIVISPELKEQMPEYMRQTSHSYFGQYEEDCDWCLPWLVFQSKLSRKEQTQRANDAKRTLKNWHPDIYEQFYGVKLLPGESYIRDRSLETNN